MEIAENEYFKIWLDDGIMYINYLAEHYDYTTIDEGIKTRLQKTKGMTYTVLADITKLKTLTKEAKIRLAQNDSREGIIATAIIFKSKFQEALYNFLNLLYKAPSPTKMFTNRDRALAWLKKFEKK